MSSPDIAKHIKALENEISLMTAKKAELEATIQFNSPDQTSLDLLRQNLKQHAEQLTWEVPELKGIILQKYIERIDAINQGSALAISFRLLNPTDESNVLLTKTLTTVCLAR